MQYLERSGRGWHVSCFKSSDEAFKSCSVKILKDEKERLFDELTRLADETTDFYRELLALVDENALHNFLVGMIDEQEGLLTKFGSIRRRTGDELPQAGDPERAHLLAFITSVQATISGDGGHAQIVQALSRSNAELSGAIDRAFECELTSEESRLLAAFRESCETFAAALEAHEE